MAKFRFKLRKRKQREIPADHTCRNCGTQTQGRYCHECGQDVFAGTGMPIFQLIGQLLDNAFALYSKTPQTLWKLMVKPGFLSEEYRIGRINRYVHPVKLFWMSTLVFFALLIGSIDISDDDKKSEKKRTQETEQVKEAFSQTPVTVSESLDTIQTKKKSTIFKTGEKLRKSIGKDLSKAEIINYIVKYVPYATFLLIPIFALLLALFFRRNKFYYMYHMTFAVHFHAFMWIFFSLLIILDLFTPNFSYPTWLEILLFFIPGVYLAIALHRFYHTKTRKRAVWKAICITLLYATLILAVTILLALLALKLLGYLDDTVVAMKL